MTEVQELVARLRLDDKMTGPLRKVRAGISGVSDALNSPRMQKGISQIGTGISNAAKIAAVGLAALATQVAAGLGQLVELEAITAQTNAVIQSTGGAAGVTAADVRKMSEEFENLNAVMDDKVIQAGANVLLTFTNIQKEAFEPTLEAALNLSTAMDQDLNTSILQIGKALNDPISGMTALRRVGVQFTDQQEEQIKTLVEQNDLFGAQQVILQELGKEFGGSFAAQGKTAKGTIAGIGDAVEDLQKSLATALFPAIQKVLPRIRELLTSPEFTKGAEQLGSAIAGLFTDENINTGVAILREGIATAKAAAPVILQAAKATATIVGAAVNLFRSLPPEIQQLAIGAFAVNKITGGLVTNIAGGLISSVLKQLVSGVVNVNGAVVNVNGAAGVPGTGAPTPAGKGGASKVGTALNVIIPLAAAAVIGDAIIEATGGTTEGQGREVGQIGDVGVVIGRSIAAQGAAITGAVKNNATYTGARIDTTRSRLEAAANRTKDDTVAAVNRTATLEAQQDGQTRAAILSASLSQSATARAEAAATRSKNQQAAFAIRDKVSTTATATKTAINNAKTGISSAARNAGNVSAEAIRRKKLSVTVPVSITNNVSVKETIKSTTTFKKFGGFAS